MVPHFTYCSAQDLCGCAQKRQAGRGGSGHFFRSENDPAKRCNRAPDLGSATDVSIMWRPLLFRRSHSFGCLSRLDSLRERIDSRAQRLNFLALPIYDIAQFEVGALQECQFRFQPLNCIAVHFDSVTVMRRCFGPFSAAGQLKPNWRYSCTRRPPRPAFQALAVPYNEQEMPVFPAPGCISNIATKLPASLPGDVFTCRDRATRVRSRPLVYLRGKS
jgi:hypothetical protein